MSQDQASRSIRAQVSIPRQMIRLAEARILDAVKRGAVQTDPQGFRSTILVDWFVKSVESSYPTQVVFEGGRSQADPLVVGQVAREVALKAAGAEALLDLIHTGVLIPTTAALDTIVQRTRFTIIAGNSASTGDWLFDEFAVSVPQFLQLAPSARNESQEFLSNGDLYLSQLDLPDLDPDVARDLSEAVASFRHGLFTACLAMLTKALEAVWIELGMTLADALPQGSANAAQKLRNALTNSSIGLRGQIDAVTQIYDKRDLLAAVWDESRVDNRGLRVVATWVDLVRDARNVLHYGTETAIENSYEKVAVLLLAAVPNLRTLYGIRRAAAALASGRDGV